MPIHLIYAVHGFLGQASDWSRVRELLHAKNEFIGIDLFKKESSGFNLETIKTKNLKRIYVGYSLGGRQGLSILYNHPDLFDHYVFISTNSGLAADAAEARQQRWRSDLAWAEKISENNWSNFLEEWNKQSVFINSAEEPVRNIAEYDLQKLKDILLQWSLAKQSDYSEVIKAHQKKITWVVGEQDEKYVQLAENLLSNGSIKNYLSIKGGHRLIFDNPKSLAEILNQL